MIIRCTDPGAYLAAVSDELDSAFRRVMASGRYALGPELEAFEAEFGSFVDAEHCVGVASGSDALTLGLRALGVGPGDQVLVPAHTFVATWLAVAAVGAEPVGVDVDEGSLLLDPAVLDAVVTPRTKVVVPVHLHGHPAAMDVVEAWAARTGVRVLADAAQAHGARYLGRGLGGFGDATAWSFYPTKNLGAMGDGGAVTTRHREVSEQLRRLRNYGFDHSGRSVVTGVNSRLDELQAALLRVKLPHLEDWNAARSDQARRYCENLNGPGLVLPAASPHAEPVWHHFVVRCRDRDRVQRQLANGGVETLVHYPEPPFAEPVFATRFEPASFPVARRVTSEVLSLPIGLHVSADDQVHIVELFRRAIETG